MTKLTLDSKYTQVVKGFGKALRKAREKKKLTQQQVADAVKLETPQFISNFENGRSLPSLQVLGKLTKVYGLNRMWALNQYTSAMKIQFQKRMDQ